METHEDADGRTDGVLVLLPYCLQAVEGLAARIVARGTATEIVRDSGHLREILERRSPVFVVGLCCSEELSRLQPMLDAGPSRYHAIVLDRLATGAGACQTRLADEEAFFKALDEARQTGNHLNALASRPAQPRRREHPQAPSRPDHRA